jgi:hypothetical protein
MSTKQYINEAWRHASGQAEKDNVIAGLKRQIAQCEQEFHFTRDIYWQEEIGKLEAMLSEAEKS